MQLLTWHYSNNQRVMPWKGIANPYFIWLSEIILQQTRVEQGLPYYEKFINCYPTVDSLAQAADEEVFKLWEGLGYYSRCRNLLKTARIISNDHDGIFPDTYEDLLSLPGIGPYTAAAIASFAFNLPNAVLDGNVFRVLARYFGINTAIDSSIGKKLFGEKANELIDVKSPSAYNQAIMDFGATICKPNNPLCIQCVLKLNCIALKTNQIDVLPVKEKRIIKTTRYFYYGIMIHNKQVLLRQREEKDIWQNLFEFFLAESDEPREDPEDWIKTQFTDSTQQQLQFLTKSELFKQTLTHRKIEGNFVQFKLEQKITVVGYEWVDLKDLSNYAFPIFIQKFAGKNLVNLSTRMIY